MMTHHNICGCGLLEHQMGELFRLIAGSDIIELAFVFKGRAHVMLVHHTVVLASLAGYGRHIGPIVLILVTVTVVARSLI